MSGLPSDQQAQLQALLAAQVNKVYSSPLPCSQWPLSCSEMDGTLMDGGFVDGPNLAQNVGQYQVDGDLSEKLKLIITTNNFIEDQPIGVLSYFSSSVNQVWRRETLYGPPAVYTTDTAQATPWRSMQIFGASLTRRSTNLLLLLSTACR